MAQHRARGFTRQLIAQRAAGLTIDWSDFAELSAVVPLLARVYPNGSADVNEFQAAGGTQFVLRRAARESRSQARRPPGTG